MRRISKARFYEQFARIGKAVSSPSRLELLDLLCQGERTVETLCEQSGLGLKNTSAQLKELKESRLIESRRDGKYVFYRLADPTVAQFWISLRTLAEQRLDEVKKLTADLLVDSEIFTPTNRKELLSRAKDGDLLILDVRPHEEFLAGHLPSAVSIPIAELKQRIAELDRKTEIVAYCRGPYCVWADEAVELLKKRGFHASRLRQGVTEWRQDGLPIERSEAKAL